MEAGWKLYWCLYYRVATVLTALHCYTSFSIVQYNFYIKYLWCMWEESVQLSEEGMERMQDLNEIYPQDIWRL